MEQLQNKWLGLLIAIFIFVLWLVHLIYSLLYVRVDFASISIYIHILIQSYLYTGLFITAHDAMHNVVFPNHKVNLVIGSIATFLFAGMSFKRLVKNHRKHHNFPGTKDDPDFCEKSQNLFIWFFTFMYRYTTISQLVVMAILYNLLKLVSPEINIILFWVVPAFVGAFQLFFFGTYLPHRKPHTEEMFPYNSRTLKKNHFLAMLSCYFFGYHWEHHDKPNIPWWRLYETK
ncbi:MAG: fatty acid desaturase [Candidatus Kapaibacteriota bacterium]